MLRTASAIGKRPFYHSVVVGGGPGGIAVLGNLLEQAPDERLLWVDPLFRGGRVNARYREVPSNTKVDLFVKFADAVSPLRKVVETSAKPNAITTLQGLPQDEGCTLGYAADLCLMLTDGLVREFPKLQQHQDEVINATFEEQSNLWTIGLRGGQSAVTPRLVLCTGSHPITDQLPILQTQPIVSGQEIDPVNLDIALAPSILAEKIDSQTPTTVAVIGGSHSAILVLMNLYNLATSTHPHLKIKWFTRHESLRYAEYKDGWILYDNTGLKGQAAVWARQNLDEGVFHSSPISKVIQRHLTPPDATGDRVYHEELPGCTHVVQAIGYQRNPIPELFSVQSPGSTPTPLAVEHDSESGRFFTVPEAQSEKNHVQGLFGAGIAFPERRVDPHGNIEYAVGFWKFMTFCQKVVPEWVNSVE